MRRSTGWITIALLAAAWATVAVGAEPVNLLTNGGFEDGTAGWTPAAGHEIARDAGAAHSGKACLTGEVTEPNRALKLIRRVPVKAANRYEFEIWAKGANRTKLVLFVTQPGSHERKSIAVWDKLPQQWRQFRVPLAVAADGMLQLEIIAPSSHGAPVGRIWVDDVALYETPMPPVTPVTDGGFSDEPAMAAADDGTVYVAYNSFRDGADSLQLARYRPQGKGFEPLGAWQVLGGKGTYVLGPRVVSAGANAAVVYAAEREKNWDVYAMTCGPEGPAAPIRISSHAAVDVKPAAAWHDGALRLAWESNRNGCRQIFAASLRDGKVSEPAPVSPAEVSSYAPSVAVLSSGAACVAWHAFREHNYDVYLRRSSAGGAWGDERRLTRSPAIDRHPVLLARGDELWLVYEHATTDRYNIGRTNQRRLFVAKVAPHGLMAPKDAAADTILAQRCEGASAAFDSSGRLWLAMLRPRLPRAGWDTFLTCYADGTWQRPLPVANQKGMDRPPSLAIVERRAIVAFQSDDAPRSWSDLDQMATATSDVSVAAVDVDAMPAAAAMELVPLEESAEPFEPAQIRVERGEDTPTPAIVYKGQQLKLFFGDLHEHSDVSVCNRLGDQSIDESYQHMRDLVRHDFACVTDHGYNINPYLWHYTAKLARVNDDPDRFLTFLAEEWTSSFEEYSEKHPYGFYGHHNLILADTYFPRWWNARNRQTPAQVWEDLRKLNANFVHIPHQIADTGNVPTDWNYVDEEAQPVAEIFQTRGSYEYQGTPREAPRSTPKPGYFIQDAWARGIVIGVIASPDHGGGYGKACVYAPELTREAILDALRARRCYGTTAAKIFLDVRVAGRLMGEKTAAPAPESVEVTIAARCPGEIERIEVCRNNQFIYSKRPTGKEAALTFTDRDPLPGRSYYYVRVIQKDEEIAWTSPVWFGAE